MKITVVDTDTESISDGELQLIRDRWNDWWEFRPQYFATYQTLDGTELDLGSVKIISPQQTAAPDVESLAHTLELGQMNKLPAGLVSLGQSISYYEDIAKLPLFEREEFLNATRDVVNSPDLISDHLEENAVRNSLLREVSWASVTGKLSEILRGTDAAISYDLNYARSGFELEIKVDPDSTPKTNIHVLIGTNGVGKTTLLKDFCKALVTKEVDDDGYVILSAVDEDGTRVDALAGALHISWSAFGEFDKFREWKLAGGIKFSRLGISGFTQYRMKDGDLESDSKEWDPRKEFVGSTDGDSSRDDHQAGSFISALGLVKRSKQIQLWRNTVKSLKSDRQFKDLEIDTYIDLPEEDAKTRFRDLLSDGHKVILLTITYLVGVLEERTLVLMDEPESHLHPPLLSAFIRCLGTLLRQKNAVALVATHSPVVLQEIPSNCVNIISRNSNGLKRKGPSIETYGEDVGELTYEVFGLEVNRSGYFAELERLVAVKHSYEGVLEALGGRLGMAGRSALRSLIENDPLVSKSTLRRRSLSNKTRN